MIPVKRELTDYLERVYNGLIGRPIDWMGSDEIPSLRHVTEPYQERKIVGRRAVTTVNLPGAVQLQTILIRSYEEGAAQEQPPTGEIDYVTLHYAPSDEGPSFEIMMRTSLPQVFPFTVRRDLLAAVSMARMAGVLVQQKEVRAGDIAGDLTQTFTSVGHEPSDPYLLVVRTVPPYHEARLILPSELDFNTRNRTFGICQAAADTLENAVRLAQLTPPS